MEVAATTAVLERWPDALRQIALTDAEQSRAISIDQQHVRDDFIAAHLLARECVGRWTQRSAPAVTIEQHCAKCGGPHGLPTVPDQPDVCVSWSHAAGHVAAAAAGCRIGIDVETRAHALPDGLDASLAARTLSAAERRLLDTEPDPVPDFLVLWTVKESLVKAGAIGLDDFATVDLSELLAESAEERQDSWEGFAISATVADDYVVGIAIEDRSARTASHSLTS